MPQVERDREIKRRRNKHKKVKSLRERLNEERDTKVRARLIAKLKKISPPSPVPKKYPAASPRLTANRPAAGASGRRWRAFRLRFAQGAYPQKERNMTPRRHDWRRGARKQ